MTKTNREGYLKKERGEKRTEQQREERRKRDCLMLRETSP